MKPADGNSELIQTLVEAWKTDPDSALSDPATEEELQLLERHVGQPLPPELRSLYSLCNGASLLGGNLVLWPVRGKDLSLVEATAFLIKSNNAIPKELLMFGGNGSGESYGIWIETTRCPVFENPIVTLGMIHDAGCFAVAGTSLLSFLRLQSAGYYLFVGESGLEALDILGLPNDLKLNLESAGEDELERLGEWAEPDMPAVSTDPYEARYSAQILRKLFDNGFLPNEHQ